MAVTPPVAAVGQKDTAGNINTLSSMLTVANTYSVTISNWASATTNPSTTARYWIHGNVCTVLVNSTLGSGAITVGNITVTLPVALDTSGLLLDLSGLPGAALLYDLSATQEYAGVVRVIDSNTVRLMRPMSTVVGGIAVTNNTSPFTWASGDVISLAFSYPIA